MVVENKAFYITSTATYYETLEIPVTSGDENLKTICRISFTCEDFAESEIAEGAGNFTMKYVPTLDILSVRNDENENITDCYTLLRDPQIVNDDDRDRNLVIIIYRSLLPATSYRPYITSRPTRPTRRRKSGKKMKK